MVGFMIILVPMLFIYILSMMVLKLGDCIDKTVEDKNNKYVKFVRKYLTFESTNPFTYYNEEELRVLNARRKSNK